MDEAAQAWVDTRYGKFAVPPYADLIGDSLREYGEWAQVEIDLLGRFIRPGQTVLDIGAFIGTHARAFSALVGEHGRVCAFEPNEEAYRLLELNAGCASFPNIATRNFGLGRRKARLALRAMQGNGGGARLQEAAHAGADIEVWPLDEVPLESPVHFMKLDVEGMELDVLTGAERLIRECTPILFLEVNSLEKSGAVLPWAREHGYACFGVLSPAFNPDNIRQSTQNRFGNGLECGLLLIAHAEVGNHWSAIEGCGLPSIETLDALALLLLHKPQYPTEILPNGLGDASSLDYPSPRAARLAQALAEHARRASDLEALLAQQRVRVEAEHAAKDYAETLALERLAQVQALEAQLAEAREALAKAASHEDNARQLSERLEQAQAACAAAQTRVTSLENLLRVQEDALAALRSELSGIRSRRGYRVLAAAGLLPKAGERA